MERKAKSRFQKELERIVSRKIIVTILTGCLLFCVCIMGINQISREYNRENHLQAMTEVFDEIYDSAERFLESEGNQAYFKDCLKGESAGNEVRYQLSKYNVEALAKLHAILTDASGNVVFSSFSQEDMNLHRTEFNRIAAENGRKQGEGAYHTVYYFSGDTSEYVIVQPMYEGKDYIGSVSLYMDGNEWGQYFSKYQYDAIITNKNHAIIYCSNPGFLKERNANKYEPEDSNSFVWANDSRYLTGVRFLEEKGVYLYSFIYSPRDYVYILSGIGTILILGLIWVGLSFQMMRMMAEKTSESVDMLVGEIRIIREEDAGHVIQVQTGDEIEEIARQINEMVESIYELNARNIDLVRINSSMEIRQLQAQMNPHFIYNTLDNIKYLIMQDPVRAEELIGRFTHILRYSINNTKQTVALREDLEYIEDYLVIQKTRFGSRFAYTVEVEEECMQAMIPKLLLQPLLENSIKYGFRKKTDICVEIKAWQQEGYLYLKVTDNGAGVPKSTLETLQNMIQTKEGETVHNGLRSINRRISLEYGRESGLSLESIDGEEFSVVIKVWRGEEDVSGIAGRG